MHNKLKTDPEFETIDQAQDVSSLLKAIRALSHQIDKSVSVYEALDDILKQFFLYCQQPHEDNAIHLKRFKDYVDVLERFGSTIFEDAALMKYEMAEAVKSESPGSSPPPTHICLNRIDT